MDAPPSPPDLRQAAQRLAVETQSALLYRTEQILQGDKRCQEYQSTIQMLQDLPKKGTAETMVPLGKAAFFPGQLVDTQQCLIRMGEMPSLSGNNHAKMLMPTYRKLKDSTSPGDSLHVHRTTSEAVAILQKRCRSLIDVRSVLDEEVKASALGVHCLPVLLHLRSYGWPEVHCLSFGRETMSPICPFAVQALEKKLAIARATLAVSLEESSDATEEVFDIREDYDEALHGDTTTGHTPAHVRTEVMILCYAYPL